MSANAIKSMSSTIAMIASLVIGVFLLFVPGCNGFRVSEDGREVVVSPELQAQLESGNTTIDQAHQNAVTQLEQAKSEGDPAKIAQAQNLVNTTTQVIQYRDQGKQVIITNESGNIDIQRTVVATTAMLPYPFNIIGGTAAVFLPWFITLLQGKKATRKAEAGTVSIVRHMDKIMLNKPEVMRALKGLTDEEKAIFHQYLTPEGKRAIDEYSVT